MKIKIRKPPKTIAPTPEDQRGKIKSDFPKHSLVEALRVPKALADKNGGQPLPPTETSARPAGQLYDQATPLFWAKKWPAGVRLAYDAAGVRRGCRKPEGACGTPSHSWGERDGQAPMASEVGSRRVSGATATWLSQQECGIGALFGLTRER